MAGIDRMSKETMDRITDDLNGLVQVAIEELGKEEVSPVLTGFFASSWKASTTRPRAIDEREQFSPWDKIETVVLPGTNVVRLAPGQRPILEQRHAIPVFKRNQNIFIGNTVKYASDALASPKSQILGFVQGKMGDLVKEILTDKRDRSSIRIATLQGNTKTTPSLAALLGSNKNYVSYMNPGGVQ